MNKTFKGKAANNTITRIRLSTNDGLTGYKIKKLQTIDTAPGANSCELVTQVFSIKPATASTTINFDDPTLLAIAYYSEHDSSAYPGFVQIVIDEKIINQDIFITCRDVAGGTKDTNYYLELEQVKLSKDEATVATLKDMRGRE
jgi:hypothetical protein